ncbi:MAG: hypothetical protein GY750_06860 [Lentisphaerae bacterium]|nr:hypothetical protein [Lentisphaerota bacterium]MCP4101130.1 hypothetical protein [Lentisphaerota bacterium]
MKKLIMSLIAFTAFSVSLSALDITTLDGKTYKNAKVTNVLPNSIDIFYIKKDGTQVIRGIKFTNLPEDIRKKYNYNPKKSEAFEKSSQEYVAKLHKVFEEAHKKNLEVYKAQQKFAKRLDRMKALIYAHRIDGMVHIIRAVGTNDCVAYVSIRFPTMRYGRLGKFFIRGLTGPSEMRFAAVIYPTGETISLQDGYFPVYDANINRAALGAIEKLKGTKIPETVPTPSVIDYKNPKIVTPPGNPKKTAKPAK